MVEVVNSVSLVQSTTLKANAQSGNASAASATTVSQAAAQSGTFVSSSIRVDNLQNVAILEYRSSEGEVVQQYPNQSQIDAFKRAQLLTEKATSQHTETASAGTTAETHVDVQVAASAPADSPAPAPAAPSSGGGDQSGGSTTTAKA